MTDHNATIYSTMTVLGADIACLWGTLVWGTDTWGAGSLHFYKGVLHGIASDMPSTAAIGGTDVVHLLETVIPSTSAVGKHANIKVSATVAFVAETVHEYIQDQYGWFRVYPPEITDLENRYDPTYSSGTTGTSGWVTAAATSISWSSS